MINNCPSWYSVCFWNCSSWSKHRHHRSNRGQWWRVCAESHFSYLQLNFINSHLWVFWSIEHVCCCLVLQNFSMGVCNRFHSFLFILLSDPLSIMSIVSLWNNLVWMIGCDVSFLCMILILSTSLTNSDWSLVKLDIVGNNWWFQAIVTVCSLFGFGFWSHPFWFDHLQCLTVSCSVVVVITINGGWIKYLECFSIAWFSFSLEFLI